MAEALVHQFIIAMLDPGHCTIDGKRYRMPYGAPTGEAHLDGYVLTFGFTERWHQGSCSCHPNCDTVVTSIERIPRRAWSFAEAIAKGYLVPA